MERLGIFKSEGGYRVAGAIYNDGPVMDKSPWFATLEEAEAAKQEMANNELAGAFIQIVSGEGEQGTVETYTDEKTEKAIIARLIKEEGNGDRWAFARIDGVRYDRNGDTLEPRY